MGDGRINFLGVGRRAWLENLEALEPRRKSDTVKIIVGIILTFGNKLSTIELLIISKHWSFQLW